MTEVRKIIDGRVFRKATASTNGGGCVGLPDNRRDAVADFKSGLLLSVPAGGLVAWARSR